MHFRPIGRGGVRYGSRPVEEGSGISDVSLDLQWRKGATEQSGNIGTGLEYGEAELQSGKAELEEGQAEEGRNAHGQADEVQERCGKSIVLAKSSQKHAKCIKLSKKKNAVVITLKKGCPKILKSFKFKVELKNGNAKTFTIRVR